MATHLITVETPEEVLASLATFNQHASHNAARSLSILRSTSYWVYDPETTEFGPGKFVGYRDMTFEVYEDGNKGATAGAAFDGNVSRNAIEKALSDSFETNLDLHSLLAAWGTALLGSDAFGGADSGKWKFIALHVDAANDDGSEKLTKPRNPPWQRDELILALDLYIQNGGKYLSESNQDIVELSEILNGLPIHPGRSSMDKFRNPNGVSMKLLNFRRFDPSQKGVGLLRGNRLEKAVWDEFAQQPDVLHSLAQSIRLGYLTLQASVPTDPDEEAFPEGRILFRIHRQRERNPKVIEHAKAAAKANCGTLCCCVCTFDFAAVYGELGEGYIEGHHTKPLGDLTTETVTKASDIALVCSNCHRMLHRRRPWLTVEALGSILAQ